MKEEDKAEVRNIARDIYFTEANRWAKPAKRCPKCNGAVWMISFEFEAKEVAPPYHFSWDGFIYVREERYRCPNCLSLFTWEEGLTEITLPPEEVTDQLTKNRHQNSD